MKQRTWTILEILNWSAEFFQKHHMDSPRVDAELLLGHALGMERIRLYAHFDRPLDKIDLERYRDLVVRRARNREPVAYLLGEREFWSLPLKVDPRVLIPRPDTERVVEVCLEWLQEHHTTLPSPRLVDVGTGSGAIALAIASELPEANIWATDIAQDAIDVASHNSETLHLQGHIQWVVGDLLEPLPQEAMPLHLVVSNPPYIRHDEAKDLAPELAMEPANALFAGPGGLEIVERLAQQTRDALAPGGRFVCEIGFQQGDAARQLLDAHGFEDVEVLQDYAGLDRVLVGRCPGVLVPN